jgi:hypothetical protein
MTKQRGKNLSGQFQIQSKVDLDFVIGQNFGIPVGMRRDSPPDFRRRILAAAISHQLRLKSIDYSLKRYVEPDLYNEESSTLGDTVSDYLRSSAAQFEDHLKELQTPDPSFGVFGAEITLFRLPHALDTARMLSNRGLLLEVLPILRLCVEMICWSNVAFGLKEEDEVISLKARQCVSQMKAVYPTIGRLYGHLSEFVHWEQVTHGRFIALDHDQTAILKASVRYRAESLALCLVVLDVAIAAARRMYGDRSDTLILSIQGTFQSEADRRIHRLVSEIAQIADLEEVRRIQTFLPGAAGSISEPAK